MTSQLSDAIVAELERRNILTIFVADPHPGSMWYNSTSVKKHKKMKWSFDANNRIQTETMRENSRVKSPEEIVNKMCIGNVKPNVFTIYEDIVYWA